MENRKKLIILVLVFALLMVGAVFLYNRLSNNAEGLNGGLGIGSTNEDDDNADDSEAADDSEEEKEKISAPDFKIYDGDGNEYTMADFAGKPVVLNFWASWCGPCKSEMPDFEEVYNEYKDDVNFVMINSTDGSRETVKSASEFIDENGYTFPVLMDETGSLFYQFGITAFPTTFMITEDGKVFGYVSGGINREIMDDIVEQTMNHSITE